MKQLLFLSVCAMGLFARAELSGYDPCEAVYQWAAEVTEVTSSETRHHPRGYLWLPPRTDEVKGIVFGMHNMLEEPIFANPHFREILAANDWGIVWVTPLIPASSNGLTADEVTAIENLMTRLASVSGHLELRSVPLCPIGHSALGGFPFRLAAAIPTRAQSMITVKGEWAAKERDTGIFPVAVSAARAGVRILQINGEYEDGVRRQQVSADLTNEVPGADFTCWVDYGGGHFDWSDELCVAMARWIVGEKDVTLTREHASGKFTILGYEVNGAKVVQNENLHLQCLTGVSGASEFVMKPFFEPTVMAGRPVGWTGKNVGDANDIPAGQTAGVTTDAIVIQKIQGPAAYLGNGQWGIRYNRYDPAGYRAKEATFQAIYPGDATFKRSVQQGQVNVPAPRSTFTDGGTVNGVVMAGWELAIPDGYGAYVREGPAKVDGNKIVLADVPAHRHPNVVVVTYKLDNSEDPRVTTYGWGWHDTLTVNDRLELTEETTCDQLVLAAGAVIDLNGYNLTVTGAFSPTATAAVPGLITNSVSGTCAKMTFDLIQGLGSEEFKKVRFGGNLALEVLGSFSNAAFLNDAHNTHTGGTTLNQTRGGSGDSTIDDDKNKAPRINTNDALGTGVLTFKNGAWLRDIAGSGYMYTIAGINVESGDNYFFLERNHALKSGATVSVAPGATFNLTDLRNGLGDWSQADYTEMRGTFAVSGYGSGNITLTANMPNGRLTLTKKEIRHNGSGTWRLGSLASPASVTADDSSATLRRTGTEGGKVTLEVGSDNSDASWFGRIVYDNNASKDWNVRKVGTGTWTVGGVNYYHGTTEIAAGALKVLKAGEIGDSSARPAINLTGGALYLAPDLSHGVIDRLRTPTAGVAAQLGVEAGETLTIRDSLANLTEGLTKVGPGTLVLTESACTFGGPLTVTAGTLVVPNGATFADIVVADGAQIEIGAVKCGYHVVIESVDGGKRIASVPVDNATVWTGAAGDGLWMTAGNWQGAQVPGAQNSVIFDGDAAVAWSAINNPAIGKLYVNGTLTLKMPPAVNTGDRGLHVTGLEAADGAKIVLAGARLSTVERVAVTCAVPLEIVDHANADESWLTGLGATWTQMGAFTGIGTVRVRGWTSGSGVDLVNDNTAFQGTVVIDRDSSNGSCFRAATSLGPNMKVVAEGTKATNRILPNTSEFVDGKLTMQLGSIWQPDYANCSFRVNLNNWDRNLLLEIGGNDADSLIMGQWGDGPNATAWNRPSANVKVRKVGNGVMKVYKPSVRQGWELNGGVVEAIGPEALDGYVQEKSVSPVSFGGGVLRYGQDTTGATPVAVTTDWSDYIRGSTDAIKVDVAAKGQVVTWATALSASNTKPELVKMGKGELVLTQAPAWSGPTTVTLGTDAGALYLPTSVSYVLTDPVGVHVTPKTIDGTSYNKFHFPKGVAVILR